MGILILVGGWLLGFSVDELVVWDCGNLVDWFLSVGFNGSGGGGGYLEFFRVRSVGLRFRVIRVKFGRYGC